MSDPDDFRLVLCECCQSEGRIYRQRSRHWGLDPEEIDCGECPVCKGMGLELIETEPVTEDDLMGESRISEPLTPPDILSGKEM